MARRRHTSRGEKAERSLRRDLHRARALREKWGRAPELREDRWNTAPAPDPTFGPPARESDPLGSRRSHDLEVTGHLGRTPSRSLEAEAVPQLPAPSLVVGPAKRTEAAGMASSTLEVHVHPRTPGAPVASETVEVPPPPSMQGHLCPITQAACVTFNCQLWDRRAEHWGCSLAVAPTLETVGQGLEARLRGVEAAARRLAEVLEAVLL